MYIDFGDAMAGFYGLTKDGTNQAVESDLTGMVSGPALTGTATAAYSFTSYTAVATDTNPGGGNLTAAQAATMRAQILADVRSYYAPFDVNVVEASATSLQDIQNSLVSGATKDAYVLVAGVNTTGGTIGNGLNGQAGGNDYATFGNATDDTVVVMVNHMFSNGSANATRGDTAIAYTIAHEAGHSFGLEHTVNALAAPADQRQLTNSDIMSQFYDTGFAVDQRGEFNFFTHVPLPRAHNPGTYDVFNRLAANVGLKPGAPAYVTGTGAFDKITITRSSPSIANVTVNAYREAALTNLTATTTYTINYLNGIVVLGGVSNDRFEIDGTIGTTITVYGGAGSDDRLVVTATGRTTTYTPGTFELDTTDENPNFTGTVGVSGGGATINVQSFTSTGVVEIDNVNATTLNGSTGNDAFTLSNPSSTVRTDGTINGGTAMIPLVLSGVSTFTIAANTGTDSLTGDNAARTYNITGAGSGTISTILAGSGGFNGVENLKGGTANDGFTFGTGGSLAGSIDGGGGTNTITGDNSVRTFTITGANSGTIGTILGSSFSNIQNLTGGTANDTFQFNDGGSLTGAINAGNGSDTLIADNAGRTFTLTGGNSGTLSGILGNGFSLMNILVGGTGNDTFQFNTGGSLTNVGNIDGGGGNDTIIGDNTGRTFTVTGTNAGTVSTILGGTFSNVENLTGGSAGDQFTFTTGTLDGNIDGGAGNNSLTGDNNGHIYTINAANGGNITTLLGSTFANIQNLTAGTASDRFQFNSPGTLAGNIDGGGGTDTLAGDDTGRTFTVTGANTGTVSVILGGTFANVENLEGGAGGDTLIIPQGGSLTGSFDGKGGIDGVNLSGLLVGLSLTVTAEGSVDGFDVAGSPAAGGLKNINDLTATAAVDTLTGLNAGATFTLTGANAGSYATVARSMTFTAVDNLKGGLGVDNFVFNSGGTLSGSIDGKGGTDLLESDDGGRTFDITGANAGSLLPILIGGFTNIENLLGGTGNDRLAMESGGSIAGYFDGAAGSDTADFSQLTSQQIAATGLGTTDGFVTTGGTSVGGSLFNVNVLVGSLLGNTDKLTGLDTSGNYDITNFNAGTYTDNPSATALAFANLENLTGGAAADTLIVHSGGSLAGAFTGKAGYDTADLSALGAQSPTIAAAGTTDGYDLNGISLVAGGVFDIDNIIGSAAATSDKLTGRNVAATWTVDAANAGDYVDTSTRELDFSNFENLSGGTDTDLLVVDVAGSLGGAFDGGLGIDTADLNALAAQQFLVKGLGAADGFDVTGVPTVAGDLKNVDALIGSTAGTTDRLTGMGTDSTFTVDGANSGNYVENASARKLVFSKVENLNGGIANDVLLVKTGGTLAGSFDGGAGIDTADLSVLTPVQAINIVAVGGTDGFNTTGGTNVAGGFQNVDKVFGGKSASATLGASDRLTNRDADGTFLVKFGVDASYYTDVGTGRKLIFANFEELFGGAAKDSITVDFSAGNPLTTTGITVDGLAGQDFVGAIGTAARDVFALGVKTYKVNGHVIRYKNFETLEGHGGAGNDVFSAPNAALPSMVRLVNFFGEAGNDVATVSPTTLAVLHLDGGDGTDTLTVIHGTSRYLTPIPAKSATSGTYRFSNRQMLEFISWEIRNIGISQPQP
jgi:hypothetical protein